MENLWNFVLSLITLVLFASPAILALVVASFAANLFSVMFEPITGPIQRIVETVSDAIPNPLDNNSLFPRIKQYFGSTKNILFICFVIVFLIFHYLSLGHVDNIFDNLFLLFPGSALEQVTMLNSDLDISSFLVNPETYLQTILFSCITGLFMHIGCTTKAPDAKIHLLVKLLYTMLISLFSSIVLGMIPSDMFILSFSDVSLDFSSLGAVAEDSGAVLDTLKSWLAPLLENLVHIIPTIVAVYFLSQSVSGFAAAFLGGFIALGTAAIVCPDRLSDPNSSYAFFLLLFILSASEVIALTIGELSNKVAEMWVSEYKTLFLYYNVVTLLISYFFYPFLCIGLLLILSLLINGFSMVEFLLCLGFLLVFALVTFVEYKLVQWTSEDCSSITGTSFTVAMVFNIPIWIVYIALFIV